MSIEKSGLSNAMEKNLENLASMKNGEKMRSSIWKLSNISMNLKKGVSRKRGEIMRKSRRVKTNAIGVW